MIKETGGPAFPINANESADRCIYTGMTLRDYFAAKAMQAIINDTSVNIGINTLEDDMYDAQMAYRYADAMLKAREQ